MTIRVKYKSGKEITTYTSDYSTAKALYKNREVYAVYTRDGKRV